MEPQNPTIEDTLLDIGQEMNNGGDNDRDEDSLNDRDKSSVNDSGIHSFVLSLTAFVIGGGIMSLPFTMKILGLIPAIFLMIFIGCFAEFNIELLIRLSVLFNVTSYGALVERAFGRISRIITEILMILNSFGFLVVHVIIIDDVLLGSKKHIGVFQQFLNHSKTVHYLVARLLDKKRSTRCVIAMIVLGPICMIPNVEASRTCTSTSSVIIVILLQLIVFGIAIIKIVQGKIDFPGMHPDFTGLDLVTVLPIMINAYVLHSNVLAIYKKLKKPTIRKMRRISRTTTVLCMLCYVITSVSCYLLFGDKTEPDILMNFDTDIGIRFSSVLIRVGFIIHLMLVFTTIEVSLRESVIALIALFYDGPSPVVLNRNVVNSTILVIMCIGAAMIPDIWIAFNIFGSITAVALSFIIPSGLAVRLSWNGEAGLSLGERRLSWVILVVSTFVLICGLFVNVLSLIHIGVSSIHSFILHFARRF